MTSVGATFSMRLVRRILIASSLCACGEGATLGYVDLDATSPALGDTDAGDVSFDRDGEARADGAGPESLTVQLEVVEVPQQDVDPCTRRCFDVTATVNGGDPPLRFVWSEAALEGPGPHRTCIEGPSTLRVDVTSSDSRGEFGLGARTGSASTELALAADCVDEGQCCTPVGENFVDTSVLGSTQPDSFQVCGGNPQRSSPVGATPEVHMRPGDSFSVKLARPIAPGDAIVASVVGNNRGVGDPVMERIVASTSLCGPELLSLGEWLSKPGCRVLNDTGKTLTHLTFLLTGQPDVPWPIPTLMYMEIDDMVVQQCE
jgi:hypothetical protein